MTLDELAHYGVAGMKWGVRKGKVPKSGPSEDAKSAHQSFIKAKRSGVEALSTPELRALNDRLNLELNYNRLSYQPGLLERGQKMVKNALGIGRTYNEVAEITGGKQIKDMLGSKTVKAATKVKKT